MVRFFIIAYLFLSMPDNFYGQSNDVFCFACSECNKVIYYEQIGNEYWPNSFGCKVEGWHSWCNIGISGNIKSKCKYCKIVVRTKFDPLGCSGNKKSCSVSKKKHSFITI